MIEDARNPEDGAFLAAKRRFDLALANGQRAEIRRAQEPGALALLPAYYHALPTGAAPGERWQRVIFMLAHARHRAGGPRLGSLLHRARVSEMRLFQLVRSAYPQDILHLRRLCRHIEPALDWRAFGRILYHWEAKDKQRIVEDYFLGERMRPVLPDGTMEDSNA